LVVRNITGQGQYIDVSMFDGLLSWLIIHAGIYFAKGKPPRRGRTMLNAGMPFYNVYETRDGKFFTVGAIENRFWANLCR
ncbi:MAG: CoA transferase, partial [Nitrososphaeria archaeon]|nr:CoA transferase [Nitrososphaeria archaeon]